MWKKRPQDHECRKDQRTPLTDHIIKLYTTNRPIQKQGSVQALIGGIKAIHWILYASCRAETNPCVGEFPRKSSQQFFPVYLPVSIPREIVVIEDGIGNHVVGDDPTAMIQDSFASVSAPSSGIRRRRCGSRSTHPARESRAAWRTEGWLSGPLPPRPVLCDTPGFSRGWSLRPENTRFPSSSNRTRSPVR